MKLFEKNKDFSEGDRIFRGKYSNYECELHYTRARYWYFSCVNICSGASYNSLLDKKYYTKEKCHKACIKYIDKQARK